MCQILNLSTERRICRPSKLRSLESTSQEVENDTHTLSTFSRFSTVSLLYNSHLTVQDVGSLVLAVEDTCCLRGNSEIRKVTPGILG